MRDAFGGVFMIRLFLVFIVIYVAFAAVSLNYAKAFRLKNSLISFIEEKEITSLSDSSFNKRLDELDIILQNANYNKTCASIGYTEGEQRSAEGKANGYCYKGIIIRETNRTNIAGTNFKSITYEVNTIANWNIGFLNKLLVLAGQQENDENRISGFWVIKGEAKVVARG